MSLVLLARLYGLPIHREHRVTYADWMEVLMRRAHQEGWRVFYVGSKPGIADRGAEIIRRRFSGLEIETSHGYFDAALGSSDNCQLIQRVQRYQPDLLLVGMSMPRQECWVRENIEQIDANAILMAGAAMDYVAGAVHTPPRWAGKCGLEWLFRLCHEPGRLWRRYLIEPWVVGWMALNSSSLAHRKAPQRSSVGSKSRSVRTSNRGEVID